MKTEIFQILSYLRVVFMLPILLAFNNVSAQEMGDTIRWSAKQKLTWKDFNGVPDTNSEGGAGTVSGFVTSSLYTSDTTICVIARAVFYKRKSWVKKLSQDSYGLKHEQGHFDITEVYARRLNTAFKAYKLNKLTVIEDINRIFKVYFDEMNKMQDLYDRETNHSLNRKKQKDWNDKIAFWLRS